MGTILEDLKPSKMYMINANFSYPSSRDDYKLLSQCYSVIPSPVPGIQFRIPVYDHFLDALECVPFDLDLGNCWRNKLKEVKMALPFRFSSLSLWISTAAPKDSECLSVLSDFAEGKLDFPEVFPTKFTLNNSASWINVDKFGKRHPVSILYFEISDDAVKTQSDIDTLSYNLARYFKIDNYYTMPSYLDSCFVFRGKKPAESYESLIIVNAAPFKTSSLDILLPAIIKEHITLSSAICYLRYVQMKASEISKAAFSIDIPSRRIEGKENLMEFYNDSILPIRSSLETLVSEAKSSMVEIYHNIETQNGIFNSVTKGLNYDPQWSLGAQPNYPFKTSVLADINRTYDISKYSVESGLITIENRIRVLIGYFRDAYAVKGAIVSLKLQKSIKLLTVVMLIMTVIGILLTVFNDEIQSLKAFLTLSY